MSYQIKYFKYKQKYLELKKSLKNLDLIGGKNLDLTRGKKLDLTGGKVTNNANLLELNKLPDTPTDMEIYGYNLKNQVAGNADSPSPSSVEFSSSSSDVSVEKTNSESEKESEEESEKEESEKESEEESEKKESEKESDSDSEGDNQNAALEAIGGGIKKDFIELSELSSISDSEMN